MTPARMIRPGLDETGRVGRANAFFQGPSSLRAVRGRGTLLDCGWGTLEKRMEKKTYPSFFSFVFQKNSSVGGCSYFFRTEG